MCYNNMRALIAPTVGMIAASKMGHDKGRTYIVIAVLNADFVLCADGKARTIEKPKQKRFKHLRVLGTLEEVNKSITDGKITDAVINKAIKEFLVC